MSNVMSSVSDPRLKKKIQSNMDEKFYMQRMKLKVCQEEIKLKKRRQQVIRRSMQNLLKSN